MTHPHLIQILSDEHCGFAMSCAGDPNVRTPNLDRLAAGGMRFEQAYANCPVCTPSRGTIFSGRHAHAGPVPGFFDTWKVDVAQRGSFYHLREGKPGVTPVGPGTATTLVRGSAAQ